jgi:hypothetical protein
MCRVPVHPRRRAWPQPTAGTDYQLQLSQTPVKDIAWLQAGQTSPILPSFMLERASSGESTRAAIHVLHARRACIWSSVASSGVPRMVPSRHSKWLQSGSCRSLGFAPVLLPSRCTGYTTYLISGCSTAAAARTIYDPDRVVKQLFDQIAQPQVWSGSGLLSCHDEVCPDHDRPPSASVTSAPANQ